MVRRRTILAGFAAGAGLLAAGGVWRHRANASAYGRAVAELGHWPATPRARLLHAACLAASSHNSQPWRFAPEGAGFQIRPDLSRALAVVDPDNHHLYASLGGAAENLRVAAGAEGFTAGVAWTGEAPVVDLVGAPARRDPLHDALIERQCTRSDYDGSAIDAALAAALRESAADIDCELRLVQDTALRERILELLVAANTRQVGDPAFVAELRDWIRFDAAQALERRDGLFTGSSGNPQLPPMIGRRLFPRVFTAEAENARYVTAMRSSSGLAAFCAREDSPRGWAEAGRACQRFALTASRLGLRYAFINPPVEVPETRPALAQLLGWPGRRVNLLLRFGRAPALPRALRRPIAAVWDGPPDALA